MLESPYPDIQPARFEHLLQLLLARANEHERGVFSIDARGAREHRTWARLVEASLRVGAALDRVGIQRGDRVVVMMSTSVDFLHCFFGTLAIGAAPIPLSPPKPEHPNAVGSLMILSRFARRVGARAILYDDALPLEQRPTIGPASPYEISLSLGDLLDQVPISARKILATPPPELAYIQPSAGSTGPVRAVALSHRNILSSVAATGQVMNISAEDVGVSWLPLDNIMSLVGFACFSLYHNLDVVIMEPSRFIERPHEWLWAIHQHRATITAAPDFAYYHCLRRARERDLEGLDLSSLRVAMSGGMQVRARHLKGFVQRFQKRGLHEDVFLPVYGLTEGTLGVTFSSLESRLSVDLIDRRELEYQGRAVLLDATSSHAPHESMHLVSVGVPLPGIEVDILGSEGEPRRLGEILFRGDNVALGYVDEAPEGASARPFARDEEGWLKTGDLGYIADGKLFLIDRAIDSPIIEGASGEPRRIFPSEVEMYIDAVDGVRAGSSVLFMAPAEEGKEPDLVAAYEIQVGADLEAIEEELSRVLRQRLDLAPDKLLTLPPFSIPKTRDGKVRRAMARRFYTEGRLNRGQRQSDLDGVVRLLNRVRSDALRIGQGIKRRLGRLLDTSDRE